MVSCVARMVVLGDGMPTHWEKALRRNGQLAVDIILAVQKWHIDGENVPDARDEPVVPIVEEAEQRQADNENAHDNEQEGGAEYNGDSGNEQTQDSEATAVEQD
jgi:hypothetical protein